MDFNNFCESCSREKRSTYYEVEERYVCFDCYEESENSANAYEEQKQLDNK